jgi:hypothetical protein
MLLYWLYAAAVVALCLHNIQIFHGGEKREKIILFLVDNFNTKYDKM